MAAGVVSGLLAFWPDFFNLWTRGTIPYDPSLAVTLLLGTAAAYLVLTRIMHQDWTFLPTATLSTASLATVLTLAVGYAGTWRALGAKAAPYLRNEDFRVSPVYNDYCRRASEALRQAMAQSPDEAE